ncbi:MAG: MCE family protein [Colwellia sp.]|nr:MCE family protein [Colwellia sp.]
MTNKTILAESKAIIKDREGISAVWLVPIIALIFGAWLIVKAVSDRGTFITVQFESASGIVVGKTQVRYKGLTAGIVRDVEMSADLQSVIVELEMISSSKKMLTDKTKFWYVTADVSFQGVTGLDTLLSGSYIKVMPDFEEEGEAQSHFIALNEEPPLDQTTPGLHLNLKTKTLGSLGKKSPVLFKQITVGYVAGFNYEAGSDLVNINLFIEPEYANLVTENSRFWNTSGITVSGSLTSGVKVHTDSLASVIAGGIAFGNSDYEVVMEPAANGQSFTLYSDYETANMGHEIQLTLNWNSGIDRGAAIMYQGLTLGKITEFIRIDPQARIIIASAIINPRIIPYLTSDSQFFVVAPKLDLGGITNLHTLMLGAHIGIRPSVDGESLTEFNVYNQKPAYQYDEPGLHLVLKAKDVGSLTTSTGVYYKQQQVGDIQAIENIGPSEFLVHIFIQPTYKHFVSTDSNFWNAGGLRVTGGLQNFNIQAQSLQSILAGGIAFDLGNENLNITPKNGDDFQLFTDKKVAKQRSIFNLHIENAQGISTKTRIMLRGEEIGSVHNIIRQRDKTTLQVGVLPNYEFILRENSQFWLVNANLSLSGITDTNALFGGAYISVNVGEGEKTSDFIVTDLPPAKHFSSKGLQLSLSADQGNVVNPGSLISFRGIAVGQVDNISLDKTGNNVAINITIDEDYRHLISNFTRFYNASGVTLSGSLGNFILKTESADAVLKGGISFFNPEVENEQSHVNEGEQFTLFDNINHAELAGIAIEIHFNEISGLKNNLKIKYHDQQVGVVARIRFDEQGFGATVYAFLDDNGKKFAVAGSKFWFAKPELALVGSANVGAILEGGFIGIMPGQGKPSQHFKAKDIAPVLTKLPSGLNLALSAANLGSVRVENPVLYRQVKVGRVIGVDLSSTADKVNIYINIFERYAPLVSQESQFWNTSGIRIDAGVFSGISIDSESIETLLAGGIAFATPEIDDHETFQPAEKGQSFNLAPMVNEDWLTWQPKIKLSQ